MKNIELIPAKYTKLTYMVDPTDPNSDYIRGIVSKDGVRIYMYQNSFDSTECRYFENIEAFRQYICDYLAIDESELSFKTSNGGIVSAPKTTLTRDQEIMEKIHENYDIAESLTKKRGTKDTYIPVQLDYKIYACRMNGQMHQVFYNKTEKKMTVYKEGTALIPYMVTSMSKLDFDFEDETKFYVYDANKFTMTLFE